MPCRVGTAVIKLCIIFKEGLSWGALSYQNRGSCHGGIVLPKHGGRLSWVNCPGGNCPDTILHQMCQDICILESSIFSTCI